MRLVRLALVAFCLISLRAESPELKAIHPVGATRGTTNQFTISGKFEPWPPSFWSEPPGLTFKTDTNKNKVTIEIPADAKPGARLVRVYNADGVSELRFFVVGDGNELAEKETNDRLAQAQALTNFPVTVSGRLDRNDDADCYRIEMRAGEWIDASLESYTLMSKVDAVLRLVTTNGITRALNHDYATFDPHLWWRAPSNEVVILQVFGFLYPANSDIRLSGGEEALYRLHVGTNPPPTWSARTNQSPALPLEVAGVIRKVGEEQRFEFSAIKDEHINAEVHAASNGSELDAWLKIIDAQGKELKRQDDAGGSRDPQFEWKAPATTNYFLVVGSTLNRAGSNYFFRLKADAAPPDFQAIWSANNLAMEAGTTNSVKIDFKRLRDHTNEISPRFVGLPEGVATVVSNLPAKSGEVTFSLVAETNAPAFQGPIRLLLMDAQTKQEHAAIFELTTRGENNGVPNGYGTLAIESLDHLWLTIKTQAVKQIATNAVAK